MRAIPSAPIYRYFILTRCFAPRFVSCSSQSAAESWLFFSLISAHMVACSDMWVSTLDMNIEVASRSSEICEVWANHHRQAKAQRNQDKTRRIRGQFSDYSLAQIRACEYIGLIVNHISNNVTHMKNKKAPSEKGASPDDLSQYFSDAENFLVELDKNAEAIFYNSALLLPSKGYKDGVKSSNIINRDTLENLLTAYVQLRVPCPNLIALAKKAVEEVDGGAEWKFMNIKKNDYYGNIKKRWIANIEEIERMQGGDDVKKE